MRLSAPAPSASAIGRMPRIVASVVIRIGRSRAAAASRTAASARRRAGRAALVRELDDQDAVLRDEADQHDEADLRKDVQRLAEVPEREQRAGERERHREQDHERIDEALELRGEHEIDQQRARAANTQPSDDELSTKSRAEPVSAVVKRSSSVSRAISLERGDAVAQACGPARACRTPWRPNSGCSAAARAARSPRRSEIRLSRRTICAPSIVRTARLPRSSGRERKSRVSWPMTSYCLPL